VGRGKAGAVSEYVIDPDQLLERGDYLMEVLVKRTHHESHEVAARIQDSSQPEKVAAADFEDSGELMSIDAKKSSDKPVAAAEHLRRHPWSRHEDDILITTNEEIAN